MYTGPAEAKFTQIREKSGSTNLPEGIVHIYRTVSTQSPEESSSFATSSSTGTPQAKVGEEDAEAGVLLAVLAVPPWMTPSDFLAFVAPAADAFRDASEASDFAEVYNGKQFNSMESEICHVVRVLSVEIDSEDAVGQSISRLGLPPGTYELPTCPVCLERMDAAVTGLVTVPCSHTFHCTCLSKWGDSRCPVCRYSQNLLSSHPTSAHTSRSNIPIPFSSTSSSQCADCPSDSPSASNLWICLICGNLGCGRYRRAHAQAHYERTTHLYALELETQRVWDYAGDGYVHRLIQNKADGKLVELPSAASMSGGASARGGDGGGPSAADALTAEKIEAIGIEYSYLLTSQLDSQRTFYEAQMAEYNTQIGHLSAALESLSTELEIKRQAAVKEEEGRLEEMERARVKAEKRAEKAGELARALDKELKSERAVSEGLMNNLGAVKERAERVEQEKEELKSRVGELEDQVRDIMFFIEARDKIEQGEGSAGEAAGGDVEIVQPPAATAEREKKGKKKKGKKAVE
ncbi:hypothetical protein EUX98_g5615 [Antrodiella citrinella]|uniref:RING-type domain-containing protein n=1 Tax=Antrodiella citrinella TaxID=2447956 RepID=A0A4S4MR06_9APHY|nr:hypothetical protein EUX98_g5615 [Antrodiella citrinella]